MNTILKALVAAACICVIGVSLHYGYTRYQEYDLAQRRAEAIANAQQRRTQAAVAAMEAQSAAAISALRAECDRRVPSQSTDGLKQVYRDCLMQQAPIFGVDAGSL